MRVRGTLQFSVNLAEFMSNMVAKIAIIFILVINTLYVKSTPVQFATKSPFEETGSTMQEDLDTSFVSAKVSALLSDKSAYANESVCCEDGCIYYPDGTKEHVLGGPCDTGGGYDLRYCWPFSSCPSKNTAGKV